MREIVGYDIGEIEGGEDGHRVTGGVQCVRSGGHRTDGSDGSECACEIEIFENAESDVGGGGAKELGLYREQSLIECVGERERERYSGNEVREKREKNG